MRRDAAPAEIVMWRCLRNRQLNGFKFRRQKPAEGFITDFVCAQVRLVLELDGESHFDREQYDEQRTRVLSDDGYEVIRFSNVDVFENLDGLLEDLLGRLEQLRDRPPHPDPLPRSTEAEGIRKERTLFDASEI